MRRIRACLLRLIGLFCKHHADLELAQELDAHLELDIAEHVRAGMTPTAARRQALLTFGSIESAKERYRDRRGIPCLDAFTQMLGVGAQLGRTFREEEDQPGHDLVVVLSHELWRRRFAEDPQIIGRTIALDGEPHTVIGVLPAGAILPKLNQLSGRPSVGVDEQPQLWRPFALWNDEPILAQMYGFACIARLAPRVFASQALAELNGVQVNLARQAGPKTQFQATLVPLQAQIVGPSRRGLGLLLAAVALVLIIGCVNIAHLAFARGSARRREMAIRRAMGAATGRLIWQMVLETVLLSIIRGFSEERAVSVQLSLTHSRYQEAATRVAFVDRLLERVRSLRGVRSAGSASRLPLSGQVGGVLLTVEGTNLPRLERPAVGMAVTDPGYFQTIGIPLQAGRIFDEADRNRRLVAVVAESVAERVWPGQNPLGQRFRLGPDQAPLVEVVGVVGNVRGVSLIERPTLHVYVPYWQTENSLYSDQVSLVLRMAETMPQAFSEIRAAIRATDAELPVPAFRTMEETVDESVAPRRFQMKLVLLVAAAAMLLACVGIYGVVSHGVAQRTNEIGIRMALGAQAADVQRLVFGQGGLPVAAGVAGGLIASVPLSRLLRSLLFGIGPTDVLTMWAAAALLGTAAAAAIYIPARRATRVDPLAALRAE